MNTLSKGFLYRYRLPSQCRIKLKSIEFWRSVISDEANQPKKRVSYCKNQLAYWEKSPEKINYLLEMANK